MSIPDITDLALLDISCRILALSSSLEHATGLIHRIQALSTTSFSTPAHANALDAPSASTSSSSVPAPDASPLGQMVKIPWTISNRYYSADVHFAAHTMHGLSPYQVQNVPAVIFVWAQGEAYKHHVQRLAKDLEGYEPEVSLAVRIRTDALPEDPEDETEDNTDIDDFLSSHGFEYIDATRAPPPPGARAIDEEDEDFADGIPHLPRVLDALSTIMWPSMTSNKNKGKYRAAQEEDEDIRKVENRIERDPVIMMLENTDDSDEPTATKPVPQAHTGESKTDDPRPSKEGDTKSLESTRLDADDGRDIFRPFKEDNFDFSPSINSPFGTLRGLSAARPSTSAASSFAFDDDFTGFVSAPPVPSSKVPSSGRESPGSEGSGHTVTHSPTDHTYRTLGSVSDFHVVDGEGESSSARDGFEEMINDDEDDLPSKEEIQAVSERIFEGSFVPSDPKAVPPDANTKTGPKDFSFDEIADLMDEGDGSYDMAQFDLSKVLTALQHMKAEIAGMENEDERRKAAAKVALGLVYGLEAEAED